MAAANLTDIYKMLGELTGSVRALNDKVDDLKRDMSSSEEASASSRANVHRRLDEAVTRIGHLETEVSVVKGKVEGIEPVTDDVKALRQQAHGAGTLGRWLIRVGIGVVTAAGWVMGLYTWLTGRPPP